MPLNRQVPEDVLTYTQWKTAQPQKERHNAICSNMDGPGDDHAT